MSHVKRIGMLALAALVAAVAACEEIENPVDAGQQIGPYVRFLSNTAARTPGATSQVLVIFQLPTRVEEDVQVSYSFGGTAVLGQDFVPVANAAGAPRTDVTATGGTAKIIYKFDDTNFGADTLRLRVPTTATKGRTLEINITGAQTVSSNRTIDVGVLDRLKRFVLTIS